MVGMRFNRAHVPAVTIAGSYVANSQAKKKQETGV